jgi:hypothetical protein
MENRGFIVLSSRLDIGNLPASFSPLLSAMRRQEGVIRQSRGGVRPRPRLRGSVVEGATFFRLPLLPSLCPEAS